MKRPSGGPEAASRRGIIASITAFACAAGLGVMLGSSARAEGVIKATNGDWETRCDTPTGAKGEQCAMI